MKPIDEYRNKFGHYNTDTLVKATKDSPELLKQIIEDTSLKSFSRSFSVYYLGIGARDEYFDYIKSFTNNECPFMSEAAFMGLFQYHSSKSEEVKKIYEDALKYEKREGVVSQIKDLLYNLDLFKDFDID